MEDDDGDYPPMIHRSGCATLFVADYWHELTLFGKGGQIDGGTIWAVHLRPESKVQQVVGEQVTVGRVAATAYRVSSITEDRDGPNGDLIVTMEGDKSGNHTRALVLGSVRPDHCQGMWALVVKDTEEEALDCQEVVDACGNWLRHGYWIEYGQPPGE